jgi:hypothetical protein
MGGSLYTLWGRSFGWQAGSGDPVVGEVGGLGGLVEGWVNLQSPEFGALVCGGGVAARVAAGVLVALSRRRGHSLGLSQGLSLVADVLSRGKHTTQTQSRTLSI